VKALERQLREKNLEIENLKRDAQKRREKEDRLFSQQQQ